MDDAIQIEKNICRRRNERPVPRLVPPLLCSGNRISFQIRGPGRRLHHDQDRDLLRREAALLVERGRRYAGLPSIRPRGLLAPPGRLGHPPGQSEHILCGAIVEGGGRFSPWTE